LSGIRSLEALDEAVEGSDSIISVPDEQTAKDIVEARRREVEAEGELSNSTELLEQRVLDTSQSVDVKFRRGRRRRSRTKISELTAEEKTARRDAAEHTLTLLIKVGSSAATTFYPST
jgi:hypothetical protein